MFGTLPEVNVTYVQLFSCLTMGPRRIRPISSLLYVTESGLTYQVIKSTTEFI